MYGDSFTSAVSQIINMLVVRRWANIVRSLWACSVLYKCLLKHMGKWFKFRINTARSLHEHY